MILTDNCSRINNIGGMVYLGSVNNSHLFQDCSFNTFRGIALNAFDASAITISDCDFEDRMATPAIPGLVLPYIALDPKETPTTRAATVAFTTSTYGINTAGTVYRMDDVPLTLRPAFPSPFQSDFEILTAIERRIREMQLAS